MAPSVALRSRFAADAALEASSPRFAARIDVDWTGSDFRTNNTATTHCVKGHFGKHACQSTIRATPRSREDIFSAVYGAAAVKFAQYFGK